MKQIVLGIPFFAIFSIGLFAQGTTSRVVGIVSDNSGAPVPNASVSLTNEGTQTTFHTVTGSTGSYVFDSVQIGKYTLEVNAPGFKAFVSQSNTLTIGAPMTINARLEIGNLKQVMQVSDSAQVVQTDTSGNIGSLINGRSMRELPIVGTRGRNPIDLVLVLPGVVGGGNTGGEINVNGARDRSWNYTVDGIDSNETSAGGSDLSPVRVNPDSLAEFRVITSNPTAEYGRNSGGQVAMITQSGTNQIHGEGFWFYRTPRLNANEYSYNINGLGKAQFVQNIYGGSIGGPIIKNRWFIFTNVQALAAYNSVQETRTVFTAAARQGLLRYVNGGRNTPSGVAGASVDAQGNPLPGLNIGSYNAVTNDPQRIGLDKTTQALISQAPLPNNFTVGDGLNTAGFTFSAPQHERQHDETFKTDFILNSKNTFFVRGSWGSQDTLCDSANAGLEVFPNTQCIVNTIREPRSLAVNWRWNPAPTITNELVVGENHYVFTFSQPANLNGLTVLSAPVATTAIYDYANSRTITTWQAVDNFTWIRGPHTLKFGTNLRYQREQDLRGSVGGYDSTTDVDFSTAVDTVDPATFQLPAGLNTAFDLPDFQSDINFLLGRVGNVERGFVAQGNQFVPGLLHFDERWPEYDFYGQDTWKITPRLTLDLGLRLETKLTPRSPNTITHPNQAIAIGAGPSDSLSWLKGPLFKSSLDDLGPSIGFAWDPFGTGKTSIRANYRIAYDRLNTFSLSSAVFANLPGTTYGIDDTSYGQAGTRFSTLSPLAPPSLSPTQLLSPAPYSPSGHHCRRPELQNAHHA